MAQEHKQKKFRKDAPAPSTTELATKGADTSDVDSMLDEIDGLLEELGQDFAENYVQKGGQ